MKKEKFKEICKDAIAYLFAITALFCVSYGIVWLICRCIEKILFAVMFFAAVALGG